LVTRKAALQAEHRRRIQTALLERNPYTVKTEYHAHQLQCGLVARRLVCAYQLQLPTKVGEHGLRVRVRG
jgi:hypothetical protein